MKKLAKKKSNYELALMISATNRKLNKLSAEIEGFKFRLHSLGDLRNSMDAHAAMIGDIGHRFRVLTGYPENEYVPEKIREFTDQELAWISEETAKRKREGNPYTGTMDSPVRERRKKKT